MLTGETPFKADTQVAVAMKHVREPLPDVQRRRPEISASLARGGRARDREGDAEPLRSTSTRWCTTSRRCSRIEAARTGQATGEATTVLRSLSGDTADFAPDPPAPPAARARADAGRARSALAVTGVFLATRTEKGPGAPVVAEAARPDRGAAGRRRRERLRPGGRRRASRPRPTRLAIDGIRSTNWDTESYQGGFAGSHKSGVGLYVDAGKRDRRPRARARDRHARLQGGGLRLRDRAAEAGGLDPAHAGEAGKEDFTFRFDTRGRKYRNYLLWISELPPDGEKAKVQELSLLK